MNLNFHDFNTLQKELEELPPFHRIAFAASCCERLLPNYSAFAREEGWGDFTILRTALDEVWQILQGKPLNVTEISQLIKNCIDAVPDADDVSQSSYCPEAQHAASAIGITLELCLEPTPQDAIAVARAVKETLFEFLDRIEESKDPKGWQEKPYAELTKEIDNHPFSVREMAKQREDLQRLKEVETLDREFLEWLRTSSHNNGKSLIDLS
ncbi:DUF416 family protein [Tychonema sp. LEGE 07199]|uniref:DUF416 family protein n=1 Tax=unclassified Tychonema TaxID=2642144 RepID=UPI00187EA98A|nr:MULTISPECIES: DUF416 family protein [unclassified Tychonema]MBE9122190.1 DUF416 family protein [Tychonema sp. LEGE 07199]MBE9133786.1 DUF416 family protein [Tychonema sp. LEGE 07196]